MDIQLLHCHLFKSILSCWIVFVNLWKISCLYMFESDFCTCYSVILFYLLIFFKEPTLDFVDFIYYSSISIFYALILIVSFLFLAFGLCVCVSCSLRSDFLRPHGLGLARLFCPWDSPGKTGLGCYFLPHLVCSYFYLLKM